MRSWRSAYHYLGGHAFLTISEALYDFVFAAMAFKVSGSALVGGMTYAFGYAAEILVSLFAGGIIDNFDRRKVFGVTMCLKTLAFLSFLLVAGWLGPQNLGASTICAFAFVIDLLHHCSRLTNTVTLYQIFEGSERAKVQGWSATTNGLGRIAGPALAGGLAWLVGVNTHLILWLSLFLQGGAWISLNPIFPVSKIKNDEPNSSGLKTSLLGTLATIHLAIGVASWRRFFIANALATVCLGTASLLFFPFFRAGYGFSEAQCGSILTAGSLGSVCGGIILNRFFVARASHQRNALIGLAVVGLALGGMASRIFDFVSLMLLVAAFQTGLVMFFRSTSLLLVDGVQENNLGKWLAANDSVARIAGLAGVLAGASTLDAVGGYNFYAGLSAGVLSLAVVIHTTQAFNLAPKEVRP